MSTIEIKNVHKIFGHRKNEALDLLRSGSDRESVHKRTGATPAVIDVSLNIRSGEVFVIMGLSGSGKSTLIRCLNLLHAPTAGSIKIGGTEITRMTSKELRALRAEHISMVFQNFGLFPHRTVLENVMWGNRMRRLSRDEQRRRAMESLEVVGLSGWENSYPDELSGGMKQRVGLARALAADTDILLMDEAFSALDPLIRREMQEQLISLQNDFQKTIVFITHDLNEAMYLGDRIAIMRDGCIVQVGTGEDILQNPVDDYVAAFVEAVDRSRVLTAGNIMADPIARISLREGPRAALLSMRSKQTDSLFVVDERRRFMGVVYADSVVEAQKRHERGLRSCLVPEVTCVAPDTPLAECLGPSIENRSPIPVLENGLLVGAIPRIALLAALDSADHPAVNATGEFEPVPTIIQELV